MRNRTIGINVRVSENEKKKLQRNAKKCNLNLSSYLRKSGLQKEIYHCSRFRNCNFGSHCFIPAFTVQTRKKI